MSERSPAIELRQRLAEVSRKADRLDDNHDLAPILADLLDWIEENPNAVADFDAVFVESIDDAVDERGHGDPRVFEYCRARVSDTA